MKAVFGDVDIPIVMCTALSAGSKGLRLANEAGSVDVLLKPYDRVRMLEVVEKHVGKEKVGGQDCVQAVLMLPQTGANLKSFQRLQAIERRFFCANSNPTRFGTAPSR